ncbi:MAG: hypothetical protein J7497_00525 [Chitinophagaceae bacterium]|nr:hypothetical protein [Chitinophagaceae bacterium]
MKVELTILFTLCICSFSLAQTTTATSSYKEDVEKASRIITAEAHKYGYNKVISYDNVKDASMFVFPNKSYVIYYIYGKPDVAPVFVAYLMHKDKAMRKKYSAQPYDIGVVGVARVSRVTFDTKNFGYDKLPVKLEAKPNATIYIFQK